MLKKFTILLNEYAYDEFCRVVGRGNISTFIEKPIATHLKDSNPDDAYRETAADSAREREALEWVGTISTVTFV